MRSAQGCILIDCGFNFRQLSARLVPAGLTPDDLTAVLVTHEHGDHASGIGVLARRTRVPVYATRGTWRGMNLTPGPKDGCIRGEHSFDLGDVAVRAVTVPHDAREPVQYCFRAGGQQLGVLTDLGHVSPHVVEAYKGCDGLLLEFNHEPELLAEGPIPRCSSAGVGGPFGHLANAQAEGLLGALMPERLQFLSRGTFRRRTIAGSSWPRRSIVPFAASARPCISPSRMALAGLAWASPLASSASFLERWAEASP